MIRHILEKYGSSDTTIDLLVSELQEHLSDDPGGTGCGD